MLPSIDGTDVFARILVCCGQLTQAAKLAHETCLSHHDARSVDQSMSVDELTLVRNNNPPAFVATDRK